MKKPNKTIHNLGNQYPDGIMIVSARFLAGCYHPPFPPGISVLITNIDSRVPCQQITRLLMRIYDSNQKIALINFQNDNQHEILLGDLKKNQNFLLICIFKQTDLGILMKILRTLSPACEPRMAAPGIGNRPMHPCGLICSKNPMKSWTHWIVMTRKI